MADPIEKLRAMIEGIGGIINPTSTLRIAMLGASGVGKTSLLATMYQQLEKEVRGADLMLTPDLKDMAMLDERVNELKSLFNSESFRVNPQGGLLGTEDRHTFTFGLGRHGKTPTVTLEFVDYPGEWIESQANQEHKKKVYKALESSHAILIPVDTPALIGYPHRWHDKRNKPQLVYDLLKMAYIDLKEPRLVIFSLLRCERYIRNPEARAVMAQKVQEGYSQLFRHLGYGDLSQWVAIVITPVQTLGEIVLEGIPKNDYRPVFVKTSENAQYSPQDNEQPLRYLLRFVMRLHQYNHQGGGYVDFIRKLFKDDNYLINASTEFARGCKETDGFAIIQGRKWLDLSETRM